MGKMEAILLDYEHKVKHKIEANEANTDFPKISNYNLTEKQLDDYLFDKQAILDSEGSLKTQYTIFGILIVLPILVLSAIPDNLLPWGKWSLFVGIGIGLLLAITVKLLIKLSIKARLSKLRDDDIEHYIDDVLNY